MESRKAARISGRPRSCHQRFNLPNGGVGSAIDRAYAGTVSREATSPRSPEAMTTSTFGARWAHASWGMLMYMLPWKRRYAGRSPPGCTEPFGLLWRTSSRSPASFARIAAGRADAIESTSGASDDPPLALRVLSGINTTISGVAIGVGNAASWISSCDRKERDRALRFLAGRRLGPAPDDVGFRRQPPSDDVLMAPRVRSRRHGPRILPRQFRIPRRDVQIVLFRRGPIDEEPDVVVLLSRGHLGGIEVHLRSRLGVPESPNPQDLLPEPPPRFARILSKFQVSGGNGPPPSLGPAAFRLQNRERLPLRGVRGFAPEDLSAMGGEQGRAHPHPPPRGPLETPKRGGAPWPDK